MYENSDEGIAVFCSAARTSLSARTSATTIANGQIGITSAVDVVVEANLCYHTGGRSFSPLNQQRGPGITKHDLWQYETRGLCTRNVRVINNIVIGCGVGLRAGWRSSFSRVQIAITRF